MPPNLWPEEIPEFREVGYGLYQALDQLGSRVLSALALHIGLPENYFVDKTDFGNSILRPIHYPPITTADIPNVRAGAHEDINLITLLVGASAAGLEVKSRKGDWVPFTADADTIVVNIGDMLQRLTNHVYPSTTHRVVNPPGEQARQPRYSTPFFLHPNPDFLIDVLPSCITPDNPSRYPEADHRAGLPRRAPARDQAEVTQRPARRAASRCVMPRRRHPRESGDPAVFSTLLVAPHSPADRQPQPPRRTHPRRGKIFRRKHHVEKSHLTTGGCITVRAGFRSRRFHRRIARVRKHAHLHQSFLRQRAMALRANVSCPQFEV